MDMSRENKIEWVFVAHYRFCFPMKRSCVCMFVLVSNTITFYLYTKLLNIRIHHQKTWINFRMHRKCKVKGPEHENAGTILDYLECVRVCVYWYNNCDFWFILTLSSVNKRDHAYAVFNLLPYTISIFDSPETYKIDKK